MKVYLVIKGEQYEGDDVIAVFKSKKKAIKFALNQPCCHNYKKCNHGPWQGNGTVFTAAGQYISVDEWKVEK